MFDEESIINNNYKSFLESLKLRVVSTRYKAISSVNRELVLLYYYIGTEILRSQEIYGWGAKIIDQLSKDLRNTFPEMKGFSPRNLKYMRKFADEYQDFEFVQEVLAQLTWYHNLTLLEKVPDKQARSFYIKNTIANGWSRNVMLMHIESRLDQRQGQLVSNFKNTLSSPQSELAHATLKDPYIFDFLSIGEEADEFLSLCC